MISLRLRSKTSATALAQLAGKVVGDSTYSLLLTGPAQVLLPDGRPLCVYLPAHMTATAAQYEVLHSLRGLKTDNRGAAAGFQRITDGTGNRSRTINISSAVAGTLDPGGTFKYCRLTAWTGQHFEQWQQLWPLLRQVADAMRLHVPDRCHAQQAEIDRTHPDWVIPGTPFTTVTVNNTYPTGMHTDKGDLAAGFSSIFALRRGTYTGGRLVFPEWRVAVDLHDGDLILMDAHQWHANTPIVCSCGRRLIAACPDCGAERISVVSYMRAKLTGCGSEAQEVTRAAQYRERTNGK